MSKLHIALLSLFAVLLVVSLVLALLAATRKKLHTTAVLFLLAEIFILATVPLLIYLTPVISLNFLIYPQVTAQAFLFSLVLTNLILIFSEHTVLAGYENTDNNFYLYLAPNGYIKSISKNLALELNRSVLKARRYQFLDLFLKTSRVAKLNTKDCTNHAFSAFFQPLFINEETKSFNLEFKNHSGERVYLHANVFHHGSELIFTGKLLKGMSAIEHEDAVFKLKEDLKDMSAKLMGFFEISESGYTMYDKQLGKIWLSPSMLELLKLPKNYANLKFTEYEKLIHPDDYIKVLKKYTEIKPNSNQTQRYRLKSGNKYNWFKENAGATKENENCVISCFNLIETADFSKSNIQLLDELKNYSDLELDLEQLIKNKTKFEVVFIKVANIDNINKKYGREIGNMALAHYVYNLKKAFVTETGAIYRIGGDTFAYTVTDLVRFGALKSGASRQSGYLNLKMEFGGSSFTLNAKAGAFLVENNLNSAQTILKATRTALETTFSENYVSNFLYVGDEYRV